MVKTYPNQSAYEAAEKSKIESIVSLIESTNEVKTDGVNVVTENPGVGDIVCYDENRRIRFIQLDTFQAGTFPSAWETVGVVVLRKGNKVTICSKNNESYKFMEVYPYIVSGYTLDGAEHTAQLRLHSKPSATTYYEFTYTAFTDSEFAAQLQQFLVTNGETDWSAYLMDGRVILQYDTYTTLEYYVTSLTYAAGLALQAQVEEDLPQSPALRLAYGGISFGIWHPARVKETREKDIQTSSANPSSDVTSMPLYPVCFPAFCGTSQYQSDHCLWMRQQYCQDPSNPTLVEWESYIDSLQPILPSMTGGMRPEYRNGKQISDMVADKEYLAASGQMRKLYPGYSYCRSFMEGRGYLPSLYEHTEAFRKVTYGLFGVSRDKSDPINRSLYAIGGTPVACNTTFWNAGRAAAHAQLCCGSSGYNDHQAFCGVAPCVPFADFDLSELTD